MDEAADTYNFPNTQKARGKGTEEDSAHRAEEDDRKLVRIRFRCALSPPSSRRGEALWEREAAGLGSLGVASSETAAGSVRLRGCGLSRPRVRSFGSGAGAVEPAADSVVARSCAGCVGGFGWL